MRAIKSFVVNSITISFANIILPATTNNAKIENIQYFLIYLLEYLVPYSVYKPKESKSFENQSSQAMQQLQTYMQLHKYQVHQVLANLLLQFYL